MLEDCQLLSALKSISNQKLIILLKIMGYKGIQGGRKAEPCYHSRGRKYGRKTRQERFPVEQERAMIGDEVKTMFFILGAGFG